MWISMYLAQCGVNVFLHHKILGLATSAKYMILFFHKLPGGTFKLTSVTNLLKKCDIYVVF